MTRTHFLWAASLVAIMVVPSWGCVSAGPASVSPADIPALEARVAREPDNGELLLRYASALTADGRCDEAVPVAERGRGLRPQDPLGPLVLGTCLEEDGRYGDAIGVYAEFQASYPNAAGIRAVEARRELALRRQATVQAREALQHEDSLEALPPDPNVVAVFPLVVDGGPEYQPLSVGLAHMIITDLSLLDRFRLVERVRLGALLDEMQLGAGQRMDPATAARTGHLLRAGRIVQGSVAIPSPQEARLASALVLPTGEVVEPFTSDGPFQDLLEREKEMVVRLAGSMGYQLSEAERQRVMESGTRNLMAFLAFSRGLMAEDRGDYGAAVSFFSDAVRQDPGFGEAATQRDQAEASQVVATTPASDVGVLVARVQEAEEGEADAGTENALASSALGSSVMDIASLQAERASLGAGEGDATRELIQLTGIPDGVTPSMVEAIISIIIRIQG